jgi:hypothetical protein
MEELLVTHEMLNNINTEDDFLQSINSTHIRCEDVMIYDKLMDWCIKLDIAVFGDRIKLTITI